MANRFWVGGTSDWNAINTTNWSATSGGAGGASVPTASDDVFLDGNSGGGTVTIKSSPRVCKTLTCTGFTGTLTAGLVRLEVSGSIVLASGMTVGGNLLLRMVASGSFTSAGATISISTSGGIQIFGSGITVTLQDDLICTNAGSTLIVTEGTLDLNNRNVTVGKLNLGSNDTRVLTMASGTLELTGSGEVWTGAETSGSITVNKDSATVKLTYSGASSRTVTSAVAGPLPNLWIAAGSGTVTLTTVNCDNLDFTGFSGTWANSAATVNGNLTLAAGMAVTGGTGTITLAATGTGKTIDLAGKKLGRPMTFDGVGGAWTLLDDLIVSEAGDTARAVTLTNGALDTDGFAVKAGSLSSSNANTRGLDLGASPVTLHGTGTVWNAATVTGLTFDAGTSKIVLDNNSSTAKTFAGGGLAYHDFEWAGGGTGTLTVSGSNGFNDFAILPRAEDGTRVGQFTAGTTQTFDEAGEVLIVGTAARPITLQRSGGSGEWTFSKAATAGPFDYLTISDSVAEGGAEWDAGENSVDGGGNTGWLFQTVVAATALLAAGAAQADGSVSTRVEFGGALQAGAAVLSAGVSFPVPFVPLSNRILLTGDMQDTGFDGILLTGDMQSTGEDLEVINGLLTSGPLFADAAELAGIAATGSVFIFTGALEAGAAAISGVASSIVSAIAVLEADPAAFLADVRPRLRTNVDLVAAAAEIAADVRIVAGFAGAIGADPATLAAEVNAKIGAIAALTADPATVAGDVFTRIDVAAALAAQEAGLTGFAITSDVTLFTGSLQAGAAAVSAQVSALVVASGALEAGEAQLDAAVSAIVGVVAELASAAGAVDGAANVRIVASGALESGEPTLTVEIEVERQRRSVLVILY